MSTPYRYDLFGISTQLYRHRRFILIITICCALVGFLLSVMRTRKYEAEAEFFLKNPFYSDRNFLYNHESRFLDYFANEDDVNRLILLAESDSVRNLISQKFKLGEDDLNASDPKTARKISGILGSNLKLTRMPSRSIVLKYTDKDPQQAAAIANYYVTVLDEALRGFYNETRMSMYQSIVNKLHEEDSMVNALTDSLVLLREKYGIYDIISPARSNIILSPVKHTGKPGFAEGLELVQNLESIKDQAVSNRAWHIALASQYTTGTKMNELPLTKVIRTAEIPLKAKGPGKVLAAVACAFAGFLFSALFVLVSAYFKKQSQAL